MRLAPIMQAFFTDYLMTSGTRAGTPLPATATACGCC